MKLPPKKRDESIVTPAMVRTIFSTAGFFVIVMLGLLVAMKGTPSQPGWLGQGEARWSIEVGGSRLAANATDLETKTKGGDQAERWFVSQNPAGDQLQAVAGREIEIAFTVHQVSVFFSIYVFFQVWNQVNCRSLTAEVSGLRRLASNPAFIAIAGGVAIGQIIIVTFGGPIFKVEPLGFLTWLAIVAGTSSVLIFAEIARKVRLSLLKD
jgi:Ca2+-transporting ATPase